MKWWILIGTGILYNWYFGGNWWPKNDVEMICDMLFGIMMLICITTESGDRK